MAAAAAKARGNAALSAKNYDEAIAAYTEAIGLDGTEHTFFSNRSAAYLSKGDGEAALKDAERCVGMNAGWAKGYGRKGAALHSLKRLEEAEKAYLTGLEVCHGDPGLQTGLADVQKAQKAEKTRGSSPANHLGKAFGPELIEKLKKHPTLSKKLDNPQFMMKLQLLQQNPSAMMQTMFSDPEMQEVLSFALGIDVMDPSSAEKPFAREEASSKMDVEVPPEVIELSEEEQKEKDVTVSADAAKKRGNDLYKAKKFTEAMAAYDEAYAIKADITYKNNKCACWFEAKEYDKCIEEGRAAIASGREMRASFETVAKIFVRIGKARFKQADWPGAIEEYKNAQVENYTKDTERLIKNLELELRKKKAQDYIDPEKAFEAKERGNGFFRDGKYGDSIKEYEDAIKRDPKNPAYNNNLAASLSKVGDFSGAKRACEKALDLDPKYVKAIAKKGDIEFLMKEYHKALDSYKSGLNIEPNNGACKQGIQKTMTAINSSQGEAADKERAAHAMADPEIQGILSDPMVRQAINDLSTNPAAGNQVMNDPVMRAKIEKLIAAGVLQTK